MSWKRAPGISASLLLACLLSPVPASAGSPLTLVADVPAAAAPSGSLDAEANAAPGQLIQLGAGDLVSVRVYGQPDMDGDVYVSNDGTISVPLLGAVHVGQLTPVEAARHIESALKRQQLLVNPHVTLQVVQSHSQLVSILGEVHSPGRYPISPDTNVIELLAQAGGETQDGADFAYVLRPAARGMQRFRIDLTGLGDPQDPLSQDILRAGDSIYVPRAQEVYVYGQVKAPGAYRFEPGMTVMEVIARAGGITQLGSRRRLELKRVGPHGQETILHVGPDDLVQPNDNIRVKESIF